jgi:TonB family protein
MRNDHRRLLAIAALTLASAVAGFARSDPAANQASSADSAVIPGSSGAGGGDAWRVKVIAQLKLDDKQQAAFSDYLAAMAALQTPPTPQLITSLPDRIEAFSDLTAKSSKVLHDMAAATRVFYATLSAAQQAQYDRLSLSAALAPSRLAPAPTGLRSSETPDSGRHTDPTWRVKPTGVEVSRVYPFAARLAHLSGKVMLHCIVDSEGYLTECAVADETPTGAGFGNAALEITAYMQMNPGTWNGVPIRSPVNVPVIFGPQVAPAATVPGSHASP